MYLERVFNTCSDRVQEKYRRRLVTLDRKTLAANSGIIEEIDTIRFKQTQGKNKNKESSISRWYSLLCKMYEL